MKKVKTYKRLPENILKPLVELRLYELEEFMFSLKGFLIDQLKEINLSVEAQKSKLTNGQIEEIEEMYADDYRQLKEIFPNILWSSLFITCYLLLESSLDILCEKLCKTTQQSSKPSNLKDKGITRSRKYLNNVINIKFPDKTTHWQEIKHYNLIRNIIVHEDGKVGETKKDKIVETYINQKKSIDLDKLGHVQSVDDFIQEVIRTLESFFNELFSALSVARNSGNL